MKPMHHIQFTAQRTSQQTTVLKLQCNCGCCFARSEVLENNWAAQKHVRDEGRKSAQAHLDDMFHQALEELRRGVLQMT